MSIQIKSFNQTLGDMVRKIIADTPLSDLNAGSVLLTLLEAAASNDFENNVAILNILELLNIDTVQNNDLDARAKDYGLFRNAAIKSSGTVSILNTNITKRSTSLYVIKSPPIAGQTTIFVNNTTGWSPTGTIYIARGTQNFEGPVAYTSIVVHPTYSEIILASALQRDHLISDIVIDSQGEPDRLIAAGTIVKINANNLNPEVQYSTLREAVLPAGEDTITGITVVALVAGSLGNAGIGTITNFSAIPFAGAAVTNTTAFSNGRDIETDIELRNRIKAYSVTLARGTAASIISAVNGISDPDDNKQVASAVITEPTAVGEPSILYIDDGIGLQPSYLGQSVDTLLSNATGKEEFLQLSNFPLPRPQVVNVSSGPFNITDGSFLNVSVDGIEETITFSASQFLNISAATLAEIITAINSSSTLFKARFTNNSNNILLYTTAFKAEFIQVSSLKATDNSTLYVNDLLQFPTDAFSYISLYKNTTRLLEQSKSATIETIGFASWNISSIGNIVMTVDNTPSQDRTFTLSDFPGAASFATLTLAQWVTAINSKFAGITATATASQTVKIISNKIGSLSSVAVIGGSYLNQLFPNLATSSVGQDSGFQLNRQTGHLRVANITAGDSITAGVEDAKGFVTSSVTTSGNYNVASDAVGRAANMVVVVDSMFCDLRSVQLTVGSSITVSDQGSSVMRIMSSTLSMFADLLPGDYIYVISRTSGTWLSTSNTGLFKIKAKGSHITAGVDSFIEMLNTSIVNETKFVSDSLDIKAFSTDGFPQVWRGAYTSNPPAAPLANVVESINRDLIGVKASVYKSNSIKITSTTEASGSIAIPVSVANASVLFSETLNTQVGNPPLIAHKASDKDMVSFFKTTPAISTNIWLNRSIYSDVKGILTANSIPDSPPSFAGTYSDILQSTLSTSSFNYDNYISLTRGNNRGQFRNIKAFTGINQVGTQEGTARTELNHIIGDELQVLESMQLSSDDSVVVIMDNSPSTKTVDISMSRTGLINSNAVVLNTQFSANDADNEPGIDFSNTTVWGTTINNTDFSDYAVHMRAHNWYAGGGIGSGQGQMLVRSAEYGPNGQKIRFAIDYPSAQNKTPTTTFLNTPSFSTLTYVCGSGARRPIALSTGYTVTVAGPYPDAATNFPSGVISSGNYFDYTFSAGNFATVSVGDVMSIISGSGVGTANSGLFRIAAKSGFTFRVLNLSGIAQVETITNTNYINIYPISGNDVATIVNTVNAGTLLELVAVGNPLLTIIKATREEDYSYAGNSTALAYGHNPTVLSQFDHISLFDGINWVKQFSNVDPNFVMKTPFLLNGVAPSVYAMDTAPNANTTTLGEYFKLIPTSIKNIHHHLTQKALSQLPIVANVHISNDRKNIEITSKNLGSSGTIEIVGGNANKSQAYLQVESEVDIDSTGSYLLGKVPAFPETFKSGDYVKIQNDNGVKRLSRLNASDSINVTQSALYAEYSFNSKTINATAATQFDITDVSVSYGRPAGFVWRWHHDGSATLAQVNAGDVIFAFGPTIPWVQNNKAGIFGDENCAGLPIIAVNDSLNYIDVVNPIGQAMAATAIGASNTVQICPTPVVKWNLSHSTKAAISTMTGNATIITVTTNEAHRLNTGDTVSIQDSIALADGSYGPVTAISSTSFSFINPTILSESNVGSTCIKLGKIPTLYRVEKLGFNNMVRISRSSGDSPHFIDCGVALDDYVVLGGSTFESNNGGRFRVLSVDNDSIIIINSQASDQLNTTKSFNNNGYKATWAANTNVVTGVTGTFKYVNVGDWVKKPEDPDTYYLQVVSKTSTQLNLGGTYRGSSAIESGIVYNELNDFDKGIPLRSINDISVFEGDAVAAGDTLTIQNIINTNWFNVNNIGTFDIIEFGTDAAYRPFIRVNNKSGVTEANRQMSVSLSGLYITESIINKFYSIRLINHAVIDDLSTTRRSLYMTPDSRSYKFSNANNTSITHMGKFGYNTDVTAGIDGYLYYTGLLRRVQRTVDGFEPDSTNYPGQRAVGGLIEALPPLVKTISIAITVTTVGGVNLGDISNSIKSTIINYVQGLDIGQDVVLSEIIAQVMNIKGVGAVTFNNPIPSTERITIANNERANITPQNIGIA
jgi:uncharacterized phage protein gp47/JayE